MKNKILAAYPEISKSVRDSITGKEGKVSFIHFGDTISMNVTKDDLNDRERRISSHIRILLDAESDFEVNVKNRKVFLAEEIPTDEESRIKFTENFAIESLEKAIKTFNEIQNDFNEKAFNSSNEKRSSGPSPF